MSSAPRLSMGRGALTLLKERRRECEERMPCGTGFLTGCSSIAAFAPKKTATRFAETFYCST